MNYRKLKSWQEAENIIPVGGKCFLDTKGERWVEHRDGGGWRSDHDEFGGFLTSNGMECYGATPYEATEKEVPISAAEAAARMVDGLPVEFRNPQNGNPDWVRPDVARLQWAAPGVAACEWRIPAAQSEEDIYQIAVPKGTDMPPRFTIFPNEAGYLIISDNPKGINAQVVKQEVKE